MNGFFIEYWYFWAIVWQSVLSSSKATKLCKFTWGKMKWQQCLSSALGPNRKVLEIYKTNLLMPETLAVYKPNLELIHAELTELAAWQQMQTDRQMAFHLYIVDTTKNKQTRIIKPSRDLSLLQKARKQGIIFWHEIFYKNLIPTFGKYSLIMLTYWKVGI